MTITDIDNSPLGTIQDNGSHYAWTSLNGEQGITAKSSNIVQSLDDVRAALRETKLPPHHRRKVSLYL